MFDMTPISVRFAQSVSQFAWLEDAALEFILETVARREQAPSLKG
tara:strand:+ start:192 stop:326 length:135 start_codon:yes stop_codon:yes gene_type:complete